MYKKIILAALCLIVHATECMHIQRPLSRTAKFKPAIMPKIDSTRRRKTEETLHQARANREEKLHQARAKRTARKKALQKRNMPRIAHQDNTSESDESDDYFNHHDDDAYIDHDEPCLTTGETQVLLLLATFSFSLVPLVVRATDYSIRNLALLMQHMNSN